MVLGQHKPRHGLYSTKIQVETMLEFNQAITKEQFRELRLHWDRVPLVQKLARNLHPHSLWNQQAFSGPRILLESSLATPMNRYTYLSLSARPLALPSRPEKLRGFFNELAASVQSFSWTGEGPGFVGGWMLCLSYEAIQHFAKVPIHPDPNNISGISVFEVYEFFVFDNLTSSLFGVALAKDYEQGMQELERMAAQAQAARAQHYPSLPAIPDLSHGTVQGRLSFRDYSAKLRLIKDHICSGDSYQLNFAQHYELQYSGADPFAVYRTLCKLNPAPFGGVFELGGATVVSASPERLVRRIGSTIQARPIAGTRRRGDADETQLFREELRSDPKEQCEHAMLVDLTRNDLAKVSRYGRVRVGKLGEIVIYPSVIHIESEITGELREECGFYDCVAAMFPGGTITGVPKLRSMELIHQLEENARSIFTGSMGYLSACGNFDLNILIRSLLFTPGKAQTWAGSGIVYRSELAKEWAECFYKARPQLQAVLAHGGHE